MSRYFIEAPFVLGQVFIRFVSLEESIPSESIEAQKVLGASSSQPDNVVYFGDIPENVLSKPEGYQWAVTLEDADTARTIRTDIYTVSNRDLFAEIDSMKRELAEQKLRNQLARDMIDGKTALEGDVIVVFNKDGVVIQKLTVTNGIRTPMMRDVLFDWDGNEPSLRTITVELDNGETREELVQENYIEQGYVEPGYVEGEA